MTALLTFLIANTGVAAAIWIGATAMGYPVNFIKVAVTCAAIDVVLTATIRIVNAFR